MHERSRALLRRMATINTSMGEVVLRMLARQDDGDLNPGDLHSIGTALRALGDDMTSLADELDRTIDQAPDSPSASRKD